MTPEDQQRALDLARAGDGPALGRLLDSFRPYVRLVVRSVRRGRVPARLDDSDLIQDAMTEAHRAFGRFAGAGLPEFVAWLRAVALRAAGHALRAHLGAEGRDAGREEAADLDVALLAADTSPSE